MKNEYIYAGSIVTIGLVIISLVAITFFNIIKEPGEKTNLWNDGVCPEDGTHWEYDHEQFVGKCMRYFYRCENGHSLMSTSKK